MDRRQQLQRYYNSFVGADAQQLLLLKPDDSARSFDCRRIIEEALGVLKPLQRRVLELACFEGLSFKEIAEMVGESTGNVRHYYYRGLCKLRQFLSDSGKPEPEMCNEAARVAVSARAGVLQ